MPKLRADNIKDRRRRLGLSQQRLAELAGISYAMTRNLEAGLRPSRSPALERVIQTLDELEEAQ
jgi:predicted transcriptional regulator